MLKDPILGLLLAVKPLLRSNNLERLRLYRACLTELTKHCIEEIERAKARGSAPVISLFPHDDPKDPTQP